jgi:hypothetical protein
MTGQDLISRVNSLSPEEQTAVVQFIDYLKAREARASTPFLKAAEQFMAEHPEILHHLSQ